MRIIHIPCRSLSDPLPVLKEHLQQLRPYKSIGVVATTQHLDRLEAVKSFLEANGKKVEVGGQILGCRQENALKLSVDCILYIGSGRFHPLGVAVKTDKPVFTLNPLSCTFNRVSDAEKKMWIGRRRGALVRAMESETFGVMVSTKDGQFNLNKALQLKEALESKGRRAFLFAAEEFTPANLLPFKVDCWVNTACPRIVDDEYNRPVVNSDELEEILHYL